MEKPPVNNKKQKRSSWTSDVLSNPDVLTSDPKGMFVTCKFCKNLDKAALSIRSRWEFSPSNFLAHTRTE